MDTQTSLAALSVAVFEIFLVAYIQKHVANIAKRQIPNSDQPRASTVRD